jgi:hypothetical protein
MVVSAVRQQKVALDNMPGIEDMPNDYETLMHMRGMSLAVSLKEEQRNDFGKFLGSVVVGLGFEPLRSDHQIKNTRLPEDPTEVRSFYTDGSQYSMHNNLPHPMVIELKDHHVYTPLKSLIAHYLAFDLPVDDLLEKDTPITIDAVQRQVQSVQSNGRSGTTQSPN